MYKGLIQKHFTTLVTVTFDTLKFVETLKEAGVPEAQAKASSPAVRESQDTAELAIKPI